MPTLLEGGPRPDADRNPEVTVRVVTEPQAGGRRARRLPSIGSVVTTLVTGALALAIFLAVGVVTGLIDIGNPFAAKTIDRSPPALLKEITNLSKFTAAQGRFQSTIDIEDDVPILPSFVAGERTVFIAQGTVPATVDFGALGTDAVQIGADGSVNITLPAPELAKPVIDPKSSHVADRDRGILDRIGGLFSDSPTGEQRFYLLARNRLARAAGESNLEQRAERNTVAMLEGFLGRLGYSDVTVTFADDTPERGSAAA